MDLKPCPERWRRRPFASLFADARGATAVEYGLIVAVIVLSIFGAMAAVGSQSTTMWNNVHNAVAAAR